MKVIAGEPKIEPIIDSENQFEIMKVIASVQKNGPVDLDVEITLEINNNQKNKFKKIGKILKDNLKKEIEVLNNVQFIKQLLLHPRERLKKR